MKKNKLLILSLFFVLAVFLTVPNLFSSKQVFAYDEQLEYIEITSVADLMSIGDTLPLDGNYILTNDINFEISQDVFAEFKPIGITLNVDQTTVDSVNAFSGIFDGNGYKIKNLQITNKVYPYFHASLFAKTSNAIIKNLAVEDVLVQRLAVIPELSSSSSSLYAAGLVGQAESTLIENCYVQFDVTSKIGDLVANNITTKTTTSVYFGGLVASATSGTHIQNSYAVAQMQVDVLGDQAAEIKLGGIAGWQENSKINNVYFEGQILSYVTASEELSANTSSNLGAISGYVSGSISEINGVYADAMLYAQNTNQSAETVVGALVGKISVSVASTPSAGYLDYAQLYVRTLSAGQTVALTNFFGLQSNYSLSNLHLTNLTQNNYGVFANPASWYPYQNYIWDADHIWTIKSDQLPTLQIFSSYSITLMPQNTSVELGQSSSANSVINLSFISGNGTIKYGTQVEILVSIINGYDLYYYLSSVQIDNPKFQTQMNVYFNQPHDNFSLTQLDEENTTIDLGAVESSKNYLLSYFISDNTNGSVSVTLNKESFQLTVKTDNPDMGKVRKKDSNLYQETFTHELTNANVYDFFAVPNNNDYAFSYWAYERVGEEETELIALDESYASYAQITFAFGVNGQEDITDEILNGGALVAVFTSNVSKITLNLQLRESDDATGVGYISYTVGGEAVPLNEIISRQKDIAITLIANANEGYEFVGWYDADNILLSDQASLDFVPTEDEISIYARYTGGEITANLLWLWITIGSVLVAGAGVAVFFIIRAKTGDYSYKKFY